MRAPPTRPSTAHAGRAIFADNKAFLPGVQIRFENIRFINGKAPQGGAFSNAGAMTVCTAAPQRAGFRIMRPPHDRRGRSCCLPAWAQAGGLDPALAQVEFRNCDFFNNHAGNGGGAALVEGAFGLFENCKFMDNSACEPAEQHAALAGGPRERSLRSAAWGRRGRPH